MEEEARPPRREPADPGRGPAVEPGQGPPEADPEDPPPAGLVASEASWEVITLVSSETRAGPSPDVGPDPAAPTMIP